MLFASEISTPNFLIPLEDIRESHASSSLHAVTSFFLNDQDFLEGPLFFERQPQPIV